MAEKTGPGPTPVAPVASANAPVQSPDLAATPSAKATVPKYGGLRGGKARDDGLVPGSPEAAEADRKKDAERKRQARADAAAAVKPAPLPSRLGDQLSTPDSSAVAGTAVAARPFVPWSVEIVKPFTDQLTPTAETVYVGRISERATKANLPGQLTKEISKDARWPEAAKNTLAQALPQFFAKWLNKTGISAENAPEVAIATAIAAIWAQHNSITSRLDKLIEQREEEQKQNQKARSAGTGAAGNPS